MRYSITCILLFLTTVLSAQLNPVKWTTNFKKLGNNKLEITFNAKVDAGWSVYSQFLEGDDGPQPTTVFFEPNQDAVEIIKNKESTSNPANRQEGMDKVFKTSLIKYKKDYTIKMRIKYQALPVKGFLEFMCCDGTRCLPPKAVDFAYPAE